MVCLFVCSSGTFLNFKSIFSLFGIIWNNLGQIGSIWKYLEQLGIIWNNLDQLNEMNQNDLLEFLAPNVYNNSACLFVRLSPGTFLNFFSYFVMFLFRVILRHFGTFWMFYHWSLGGKIESYAKLKSCTEHLNCKMDSNEFSHLSRSF